jgi:TonB family protein
VRRGGRGEDRVALADTFDLLEIAVGDVAPDEGDRFDSLAINDNAPVVEGDRAEPTLAATPFFVEFDEPARLDPDRVGLIWELPRAPGRPIWLRSPLVSLAVHLLPLLLVTLWPNSIEVPHAIPVQLVFEEPPPPPQPQSAPQPPAPQQKLESGRLASVDMGDVKQKDFDRSTSETPAAAGDPQPQPTDTQTATTTAPAPPLPAPKPAPPKEQQPAVRMPKPSGAPVPRHDETPHEAPHAAHFAGMASTRDEYLAYLVSLTRQHIDLLPLSVVGDRRGETVISVVVYDNGALGPIGVTRSSGYPDIDRRIEQMVAAVRKFPPLPQWYQGNAVQLELTLKFPEALDKP